MNEYNEEKLIYESITVHTSEVFPDKTDLWPRISSLLPRKRRSFRARVTPTTRLGWIVVILALLVGCGAAAYGGKTLTDRYLKSIERVHPIGLSQTINGITVTIDQAHFTDEQMALEFTISGMPEPRYYEEEDGLMHFFGPDYPPKTFITQTGAVLEPHGLGSTGHHPDPEYGLPPGTQVYLEWFELSEIREAIGNDQTELQMTFSLPAVKEWTYYADPPIKTRPSSYTTIPVGEETLAGPFTFDLVIPLEANQ